MPKGLLQWSFYHPGYAKDSRQFYRVSDESPQMLQLVMANLLRATTSVPLLLVLAAHCLAADELPKRQIFDRYAVMLNKSPFAVATAVAAPAATPNFAKDLYVANAARTPGEDLVTVMSSSDKAVKEYLSTKGPNDHGYSIANIEWSDRPGATKVTISKDGQFAALSFNQALIASAPPPPGQMPPQQPAGVPPVVPTPMPNYVPPKSANVPGYPMPSPRVRGVIQRNPNAAPRPRPTPNPNDDSADE